MQVLPFPGGLPLTALPLPPLGPSRGDCAVDANVEQARWELRRALDAPSEFRAARCEEWANRWAEQLIGEAHAAVDRLNPAGPDTDPISKAIARCKSQLEALGDLLDEDGPVKRREASGMVDAAIQACGDAESAVDDLDEDGYF